MLMTYLYRDKKTRFGIGKGNKRKVISLTIVAHVALDESLCRHFFVVFYCSIPSFASS